MKSFLSILIALLGMFPLFSNAQSANEVSLQFISFPIRSDPQPIELALSDSKTLSVELPCSRFSKAYKVPALSEWVMGKTIKTDGKPPTFDVYARAKASGSLFQLVLLIRKGDNDSDGFHPLVIDMDPREFTGGGFYFVNVSSTNIGVSIGDKKFGINPGKTGFAAPHANVDGDLAQVALAREINGKWELFSETRWIVHPKRRTITFFYQDPGSDDLKQHTIGGFLP